MDNRINEIVKMDSEKAAAVIRDRIRASFISLIPDDQWDKMIQTEIDAFMKPQTERGYSGERVVPSGFSTVIKEELTKTLKTKLEEHFSSPQWQSHWEGCKPVASEMMRTMIIEHTPEIMAYMFQSAFQASFQDIKNRFPNGL